jgi:hypothetical protein
MDAFTALLLVVLGFALGYGAMWAYCRFIRDRKQPTR